MSTHILPGIFSRSLPCEFTALATHIYRPFFNRKCVGRLTNLRRPSRTLNELTRQIHVIWDEMAQENADNESLNQRGGPIHHYDNLCSKTFVYFFDYYCSVIITLIFHVVYIITVMWV